MLIDEGQSGLSSLVHCSTKRTRSRDFLSCRHRLLKSAKTPTRVPEVLPEYHFAQSTQSILTQCSIENRRTSLFQAIRDSTLQTSARICTTPRSRPANDRWEAAGAGAAGTCLTGKMSSGSFALCLKRANGKGRGWYSCTNKGTTKLLVQCMTNERQFRFSSFQCGSTPFSQTAAGVQTILFCARFLFPALRPPHRYLFFVSSCAHAPMPLRSTLIAGRALLWSELC